MPSEVEFSLDVPLAHAGHIAAARMAAMTALASLPFFMEPVVSFQMLPEECLSNIQYCQGFA